jgi:YHS domain-containing protein
MKKCSLFCLIMMLHPFSFAQSTANIRNGIMLYGYDPVSYFNAEKPTRGLPSISVVDKGETFLFTNQANKAEFEKKPEKYRPAYEGWCATAVAGGYKYDIDPENFKITDGRLFLFYKGWRGDAKKDWLKAEPEKLKLADKQWPLVRLMKE